MAADQLIVDGKEYISSKRASELSGYTQDYIGQLARGGGIDAKRIGGLWFLHYSSLEQYKAKADEYKPQPPLREGTQDIEALLTFDGNDYISAARAAEITGYHQDYVGQLARGGAILSRQVGNRWYVEREGLLAHKREKDGLLAAVQAESVGIRHRGPEEEKRAMYETDIGPQFTYITESRDLMPSTRVNAPHGSQAGSRARSDEGEAERPWTPIPIHKSAGKILDHAARVNPVKSWTRDPVAVHGITKFYKTKAALAIYLIFIAGVIGYAAFAVEGKLLVAKVRSTSLGAAAAGGLEAVGAVIEPIVVPGMFYKR